MVVPVLALSILVQAAAAVFALRLIRLTGRRAAAALIALALTLMAVRRILPLCRLVLAPSSPAPDLANELIGLAVSVIMAAGIMGIAPLFQERRRIEASLRESETRFRSLIHKVRAGIVLHDGLGRVLDCNPLAEELLGLSADQRIGKALVDPGWHFLKEDGTVAPADDYPVAKVLATGQPVRNLVLGVEPRGPGQVSWLLVNAEPIFNSPGDLSLVIVSFLDITERKLAEEVLRTTVRSYSLAQAISHVGNWEYDLATTEFWGSDEAKRIYGFDPLKDSFSTEEVERCIPERARVHQALVDLVEAGKPYQLEFEIHPRTGAGPRIITSVAERLPDEEGRPRKVVGVIQDITERKRAEQSLQQLHRELRALGSCSQLLVKATDEHQLLLEICRILCEDAGYRMAWVGFAEQDDDRAIRPVAWAGNEQDYLARTRFTWSDSAHGQGPAGVAVRTGRTDCSQDVASDPRMAPWLEQARERGYRSTLAMPLKDESERVFGVMTVYSAQTDAFPQEEIRLMEELAGDLSFGLTALRARSAHKDAERNLALLNFALDNVREAAFLIDADSRFRYVNEGACKALGYQREELLARGVADLDPDFPPARWSEHWRELEEKRALTFEGRHRRKDGQLVPVEISANRIEFEGEAYNLALARDITERKRGEENLVRLAHAQKMEAIGTLAGGIAHDFNNILTGILGFTEVAIQQRPGGQVQHSLEHIHASSLRAAELVKHILTFSRMAKEEPKPVQPRQIADEAMKLLRASIPSTIEIQAELRSPSVVMADPGELHRVLVNLATNAALAMKEAGGILRVTLDDVDLDAAFTARHPEVGPGRYVRLVVEDTGCGMTEEVKAHIFEPFYTTRQRGEGTGLGLSVVHGIVLNRGGTISVTSAPGRGTTFAVFLPAVAAATAADPSLEDAPSSGTEHILFVDDEEFIAEVATLTFRQLGYRVTACTSGSAALETFLRTPDAFEVLISDVTMPGMTGDQLAAKVRALRPDLPIILCSGFSERMDEAKAKALGLAEYVLKPVTAVSLSRLIRKALDARPREDALHGARSSR